MFHQPHSTIRAAFYNVKSLKFLEQPNTPTNVCRCVTFVCLVHCKVDPGLTLINNTIFTVFYMRWLPWSRNDGRRPRLPRIVRAGAKWPCPRTFLTKIFLVLQKIFYVERRMTRESWLTFTDWLQPERSARWVFCFIFGLIAQDLNMLQVTRILTRDQFISHVEESCFIF